MYTSTSPLTLILTYGTQSTREQNYVALWKFKPDLLPNKLSFVTELRNVTDMADTSV